MSILSTIKKLPRPNPLQKEIVRHFAGSILGGAGIGAATGAAISPPTGSVAEDRQKMLRYMLLGALIGAPIGGGLAALKLSKIEGLADEQLLDYASRAAERF